MTRKQQLHQLAQETSSRLVFSAKSGNGCRAWPTGKVHTLPLEGCEGETVSFGGGSFPHSPDVAYAITLHELGHRAYGHVGQSLQQEIDAWNWALDNFMGEITNDVRRVVHVALGSYLAFYRVKSDAALCVFDRVGPVQ